MQKRKMDGNSLTKWRQMFTSLRLHPRPMPSHASPHNPGSGCKPRAWTSLAHCPALSWVGPARGRREVFCQPPQTTLHPHPQKTSHAPSPRSCDYRDVLQNLPPQQPDTHDVILSLLWEQEGKMSQCGGSIETNHANACCLPGP